MNALKIITYDDCYFSIFFNTPATIDSVVPLSAPMLGRSPSANDADDVCRRGDDYDDIDVM